MIELKEEDIKIQHLINSPYLEIKKWHTSFLGKEIAKHTSEAEQLKQQILSDHKLAVEVRNATKMAHSLGQAGIEDDIRNGQIVKRLEERIKTLGELSKEDNGTQALIILKLEYDYLQKILFRLTTVGAIYLSVVCVLPMLLSTQNIPFYFGGTSLLILVGVSLDTAAQIESHLLARNYEGFMKQARTRGRRG